MKTKKVKQIPRTLKKLDKKQVDINITSIDDIMCPLCSGALEKEYSTSESGKKTFKGLVCECGHKEMKPEGQITLAVRASKKFKNVHQ